MTSVKNTIRAPMTPSPVINPMNPRPMRKTVLRALFWGFLPAPPEADFLEAMQEKEKKQEKKYRAIIATTLPEG
ncbi:hypothetical protein [Oxalicibacterium solurbis]|uniref:hypothetical protein n=1 Tax=Oxalicibacterium solurbis TaxID=69280 RepID=UPI001E3F2EB2|nr:hypothetical protein [Oxalicibacterium solurbis]